MGPQRQSAAGRHGVGSSGMIVYVAHIGHNVPVLVTLSYMWLDKGSMRSEGQAHVRTINGLGGASAPQKVARAATIHGPFAASVADMLNLSLIRLLPTMGYRIIEMGRSTEARPRTIAS